MILRRLIPLVVLTSVAFCALSTSAMAMPIYIKTLTGRTVSLECESDESIDPQVSCHSANYTDAALCGRDLPGRIRGLEYDRVAARAPEGMADRAAAGRLAVTE